MCFLESERTMSGAIMTLPITIADKNIMCRAEELIKQSFYQSKTEIKTQRSPQNQSVLQNKESMSEQLSNLKLNCEEDDNGDFKHKSNEDQLQGSDEEDTYIDKDDQDEYSDASDYDYDDQYEDDDDDGNELYQNRFDESDVQFGSDDDEPAEKTHRIPTPYLNRSTASDFEVSFGSVGSSDQNDSIEFDQCEDDSFEEIPEWFAHEDYDQIKAIFQLYSKALKLQNQRCVREPPKFVGKIKRCKITNDELDFKFQTLDQVDIYRRALLPPGLQMPHVQTIYLLTSWSFEDGLPLQIEELTKSQKRAYQKRVKTNDASFLLCLPVFSSSCDYDFSVETEEKDVRHSPRSYPHHCYDEYIPNKLHKSSSFKEEDEF